MGDEDGKLFGALSLAKRAGALVSGFDAVCEAAAKGEAYLVVITKDTSEKTQKRVTKTIHGKCTVSTIPLLQEDIAVICKKPVGVLAVTNIDLAALCLGKIPKVNHEEEPV